MRDVANDPANCFLFVLLNCNLFYDRVITFCKLHLPHVLNVRFEIYKYSPENIMFLWAMVTVCLAAIGSKLFLIFYLS